MTEPKVEPQVVAYQFQTNADYTGEIEGRNGFRTFSYSDGGISRLPTDFFHGIPSTFYFGKCSAFGKGSCIRGCLPEQIISVGGYLSAGESTIIMGSGFHEINTISTFEFGSMDDEMKNVHQRNYGDIEIKNDVWIGDECMIMAGSIIENGCIIGARSLLPPRFKSEPFGIYVGSPARLKKFRFTEKVRELLLDIAWWEMPYQWIKAHNNYFICDMTLDNAVDNLLSLKEKKLAWMNGQNISVA